MRRAKSDIASRHSPGKLTDGSGPLRTIGVIAKANADDSPLANPFYSQVISGIEEACRQRNVNMLLAILPTDQKNYPLEIPRVLTEDQAEGLVLIGAFVDHSPEVMLEARDLGPCADEGILDSSNSFRALHLWRAGHSASRNATWRRR
jgi:hypothetical protein